MAFVGFYEIFLALISIFAFAVLRNNNLNNRSLPINWPIVGMVPALLLNFHRAHDYICEVIEAANMTLHLKGPWLSNINYMGTVDPANIRYITISNFSNFPKGPDFKEMFDFLGDGIFNSDFELWKTQRKSLHAIMSQHAFNKTMIEKTKTKVVKGLVPVLDHLCKERLVIDLQDLFGRFTFDLICILSMSYDPLFLTAEFPENEFAEAIDILEDGIVYRHVKPMTIWKLQRWMGVGEEKKMKKAREILDRVVANYVSMKKSNITPNAEKEDEDLLTYYMNLQNNKDGITTPVDDKFLKDTILNVMLAGKDTTSSTLSWFFWLVCTNPKVFKCIRDEIQSKVSNTQGWRVFELEEVTNLVYLHGALCETLRLYPPLPFEHKSVLRPDVLPSGHHVSTKTKIGLSLYAMGRMRAIWGDDCMEFKPERWITDQGKVKYQPSYKFLAFNAGPRTCLGKNIAFTQLKLVATTMIHNYNIEVMEHPRVSVNLSLILRMRHGFHVKVAKRSWI